MIIVKKQHELAAMPISAKKTATILHKVASKVAPGVNLEPISLGKRLGMSTTY